MNPEEFQLAFFKKNHFARKQCPKCGRHFWSLGDWETCGEPPCEEYTFIGNSPMNKPLSLHQMREEYLSFFESHGHRRVKRYPIVARWRDDVFFTQASIYDFQPWVLNEVIEPPGNPLTISQTCVRFNDIDNVGKTGRHFTFFEMCAHHVFNKKGKDIYFKDGTVALCHELFADRLGVDPKRIRYIEEWWEGGGNAGPCVEVIIDGAEVATLVFMMYRTGPGGNQPMNMTVVDTGYGLERMTWVSQGTSSAYEAVFGPVLDHMKKLVGVTANGRVLEEYSKVAGMTNAKTAADVRNIREQTAARIGISYDELMRIVSPLEDIYVICDHTRALALLLNDGVVPSNVREGYFARMLVRRALRSIRSLGIQIPLAEVVGMQIDHFVPIFPELAENKSDILRLVAVEEDRYKETLARGKQLVDRMTKDLKKGERISTEKLIELYDSHGLNPELVKEFSSVPVEVPDDFYKQVAARHEKPEAEEAEEVMAHPEDLPVTRALYYEDVDMLEFQGEVLDIVNGGILLDQTAFYPEGGGQEWDLGTLDHHKIKKVVKVNSSILHFIDGPLPEKGKVVTGRINKERRVRLMRHHTSAHIINGAARKMLGNHVWQAGAHKSEVEGRLDITHYENLTQEQRDELEREVNRLILEDLKVRIQFMQRDDAEALHGYRLYQGGAVPGKVIRVVEILGLDAEACGGLHCKSTGFVGGIRIRRTKRIQDGIVRIEYSSGMAAVEEMQRDKTAVETLSERLNTPMDKVVEAADRLQNDLRESQRKIDSLVVQHNQEVARALLEKAACVGDVKVVVHQLREGEDAETISRAITESPRTMVVIGVAEEKAKLLVARSQDLDVDCRTILKEIMKLLGGGGGGKKEYAQGGGGEPSKLPEALNKAPEIAKKVLDEHRGVS
ncbi:MAG TPA: alanine--tRNA ligase [Methanomassiliicoccales archaeon]|nr:alanine--tRNA ligase [Methanomassiliicoccales archaeon]